MRKTTKIHHPALKQESTVDERSLHVWEASGWVRGPLETANDDSAAETREQPADEPSVEEVPAAPRPGRAAKPKTPADSPATPDA